MTFDSGGISLKPARSAWELDRAYVGKGASDCGVRPLVELAKSYCA